MRIVLADHQILTREGLVGLLSQYPGLEVVGTTGLAREAIEKTLELEPDILLLETNLPDGSGLDVLKAITPACPQVNVIILTSQMNDDMLLHFVENGAKGYLLKNIPVKQLIESLKGVMRGETAFQRTTTRRLIDQLVEAKHKENSPDGLSLLTYREQEVLDLVGLGYSNAEIAGSLKISENTVKAHVRKILDKLQIKNRREARNLVRSRGRATSPASLPSIIPNLPVMVKK